MISYIYQKWWVEFLATLAPVPLEISTTCSCTVWTKCSDTVKNGYSVPYAPGIEQCDDSWFMTSWNKSTQNTQLKHCRTEQQNSVAKCYHTSWQHPIRKASFGMRWRRPRASLACLISTALSITSAKVLISHDPDYFGWLPFNFCLSLFNSCC